jgi:hypothetical protein
LVIGVAYQEVTGTDNNISEIVISNWPKKIEDKVPSEISYSPAPGGERQWGYDFGSRARKLVWTKLELGQQRRPEELQMILDALNGMENLNFDTIRRSGGLPAYPAKDPVDIVADYLTYVREHLMENLVQDYSAHYISTVPVDIVFTVPAVSGKHSLVLDSVSFWLSRCGQILPKIVPSVLSAKPGSTKVISRGSGRSLW